MPSHCMSGYMGKKFKIMVSLAQIFDHIFLTFPTFLDVTYIDPTLVCPKYLGIFDFQSVNFLKSIGFVSLGTDLFKCAHLSDVCLVGHSLQQKPRQISNMSILLVHILRCDPRSIALAMEKKPIRTLQSCKVDN